MAPYKSTDDRDGPYVVVFWMLSRLVLVRKGCDVAFGPYSQSNMAEQATIGENLILGLTSPLIIVFTWFEKSAQ